MLSRAFSDKKGEIVKKKKQEMVEMFSRAFSDKEVKLWKEEKS